MQSPWPTLTICLSYAYLVKVLGPSLMKNREPMQLRWIMVGYNFFMVAISLVIFLLLGFYGWFGHYNWKCQPVDYTESSEAILMTHLSWWYYISKFVEFVDTVSGSQRRLAGPDPWPFLPRYSLCCARSSLTSLHCTSSTTA